MSKYKVGDKVILTVTSVAKMGCYYVLNDRYNISEESIDKYAEPLSTYTEPLEAKIRRQAAEITRLLAENKELKEDFEKSKIVNLNMGRVAGQEEAWKLARKIVCFSQMDRLEIFETEYFPSHFRILKDFTYPEAAAKVAEWEKAKEEIKVGDVVSREGLYGVVKSVSDDWLNGITASGISFQWLKRKCTQTGRHIDIDGFLKQIGEDKNEDNL